jgi:predicted TIM-barrel fold metal-dependent hydrolase
MSEILDAYCTIGTERDTRLAPDELLRMMDSSGVRRAVIAPEDREIVAHNAQGNARIAEIARQSAARFIPACTVNPWFGDVACRELRRAVAEGARMLVLAPALQGFCFGDELPHDVLTVAGELRVPVYVHTGPHSFGAPSQVILAAAAHPSVQFVLGHCGSTDYACDMPAIIQMAAEAVKGTVPFSPTTASPQCPRKSGQSLALENVWFELSLVRPWAAAGYVKLGDRRRFLFGSSAPRNNPAYELRHLGRYLSVEEYADVYGGNLAALLGETLS